MWGPVPLRRSGTAHRNADSRYIWCRIRATTQFNNDGKPVKAVGVIVDIDSEKRRAQDLLDKAERDHPDASV